MLTNILTPGEFLVEKVIKPLNLSVVELAKKINVPPNRLYLIVKNKRQITPDTALRLGHFLGTGPEMWLYVQMAYDLECEKASWEKERILVSKI